MIIIKCYWLKTINYKVLSIKEYHDYKEYHIFAPTYTQGEWNKIIMQRKILWKHIR